MKLLAALALLLCSIPAVAQGAVSVILEEPPPVTRVPLPPPPAPAIRAPVYPSDRMSSSSASPPAPPVIASQPAAVSAPPAQPSIFGATAWVGTSGSMQVGMAIPLAAWRSIFKLGQGELVVLIGKDEAGLGLGHKFRDVHLDLGGVSAGAAIGVAGLLPYSATCDNMQGHACRTGLRATRAALFVTLPLSPRSAQ